MSATSRNRLIVLDPALGPNGGHHVALRDRVYRSLVAGEFPGAVDFYGNRKLSGDLGDRIKPDNFRIFPFFCTEFYHFYTEKASLAAANHYIAVLGDEYLAALLRIIDEFSPIKELENSEIDKESEFERLLIFYPAMQWEHLMALHYALREIDGTTSGPRLEHRVCLMYNPGRDYSGEVINTSEWLSYKLACKPLLVYENVRLYASDYELANHFGRLLELNEPLPLHPQYLAEMNKVEFKPLAKSYGQRIGLYFGDAKIEKGFARLPGLIKKMLPSIGNADQIIVQYVSSGNCPRILAAEKKMKEMSAKESRIKLIPKYLSLERLQSTLTSLDVFVFSYDLEHYRNKSSGFLWMLVDKPCVLVFLGESWLSREASRLGLASHVCSVQEFSKLIRDSLKGGERLSKNQDKPREKFGDLVAQNYKNDLYRSFFDWLYSESELAPVEV